MQSNNAGKPTNAIDVEDLAQLAVNQGALHRNTELAALIRRLKQDQLSTVVEIGSKKGATLYLWCQLAEADATIVSLDPPHAPIQESYSSRDARRFFTFTRAHQTLFLLRRDPHDPTTHHLVEAILG